MAAWKVHGQIEHISERDTARESNTYDAGFMQMFFFGMTIEEIFIHKKGDVDDEKELSE